MKKIQILTSLLVILLAVACKNAGSDTTAIATDTTATTAVAVVDTMMATTDTTAIAFVCSMHPEITGKEGDKCSKCGMALVSNKKAEPGHEGHNH